MPRVLIVDDDNVLSDLLSEYLSSEGCSVSVAADGLIALDMLSSLGIDIVVLDIMMPRLSGIETLKKIRESSTVPVIMLTARGDDLDRILGLELGADDYLSKPCNPRELYARVKAVLRRTNTSASEPAGLITFADLTLNYAARKVIVAGSEVNLTQTEFDLLYLLLKTPGQLVCKSDISLIVLEKSLSQWDRSIDVHISNLRKKLGSYHDDRERIRTIRGSGYLYQTLPKDL